MAEASSTTADSVLSTDALLAHWQGHRRLTRRVIEAYPEDQLFTFSVGAMRPFGELVLELLNMAEPMARGLASNDWTTSRETQPQPKAELLRRWDEGTRRIDEHWQRMAPSRLNERMKAFGLFDGRGYELLLYVIDNEVHHRGQGYVYLRALGVEPPPFWER